MVTREGIDRPVSGDVSGASGDPEIGLARTWHYIVARSSANHLIVPHAANGEVMAQPVPHDAFLADVLACLHELSRQQRNVLLADLAAGGTASATDLAQRMQTTRNTIYVARAVGRKALRAGLLKRGYVLGHGPGWSMSLPGKEA